MGKHEGTPAPEERLDYAGRVFRASQTDNEIVALMQGMDFVNHALLGLYGGTLARLSRDIRDGHTVLPGRTRYESLDLVNEAYLRGLDFHRRLAPELRRIERKHWWSTRWPHIVVMAIVMAFFTTLAVFFNELVDAASSLSRAAGPSVAGQEDITATLLPVFEVGATYVLPLVLAGIALSLFIGAVIHVLRR